MASEYRLEEPVGQFLNDGGSPGRLPQLLGEQGFTVAPSVVLQDLTNDGVPEVLVRAYESLVFACENGRFINRLPPSLQVGESVPAPWSDRIADMNANGMPDLVLAHEFWGAHNYTLSVEIYEWDGATFRTLIADERTDAPFARNGYGERGVAAMYNGNLALVDVDANGTIELLLEGGLEGGLDAQLNGGPQRSERHIWMWNGLEFILQDVSFSPATYRYQAIQDGDDASLVGDFDGAMSSYKAAIEDADLEGWNPAWLGLDSLVGEGTPAPTFPPADPDERPRLEAYARFRMLLIELARGRLDEAENQLRILKAGFGQDSSAYPFVELSEIVWDAHLDTQGMGRACSLAIDYASAHEEQVLAPLGSTYYGFLNRDYDPQDICPFH